MVTLAIKLTDDVLARALGMIDAATTGGGFPKTEQALSAIAGRAANMWRAWAMGSKEIAGVDPIKRPIAFKQKLATSIAVESTGDMMRRVYSDSKEAQEVANGTPAFDMKTTHPFGKRSRVSKKEGIPYLIVPIRWGTPNDKGGKRAHFTNFMPSELYKSAKKISALKRTGETKIEPNFRGEDIRRDSYAWGEASSIAHNAGFGTYPIHSIWRAAGGGGYRSFRVISAKQLVTAPYMWVKPAIQAVDVVSAIAKQIEGSATLLVSEALLADLGALASG